jgi:hypothetical protein
VRKRGLANKEGNRLETEVQAPIFKFLEGNKQNKPNLQKETDKTRF